MSKPFSVTAGACVLGYSALAAYSRSDNAVSPCAREARRSAGAIVEAATRSTALFGAKALAISQLRTLAQECEQPGWDGEAAERMNPMAVNLAEELIRVFPERLPLPEFAPEPDGSVSLDWVVSRHRSFTVSVGTSRRLAYAWLDGSDKGHGVARFDGVSLPPRILEGIWSIVEYANAAVWPS